MTTLINPTVTRKAVAEAGAWIKVELTPQGWGRFQWEPVAHRVAHFWGQAADWYRWRGQLLDIGEDVR